MTSVLILVVYEACDLLKPRRWIFETRFLLATLLLMVGSVSDAPEWHMLETSCFTVLSQISEKETRIWSENFNQFIEALKSVLPVDDRYLPRLTVVIFSRNKDFGVYRPVGADGKVHDWVDAYFSRQETWSVIGLAGRFENESMRRLIFHEGVHWYLRVCLESEAQDFCGSSGSHPTSQPVRGGGTRAHIGKI